jgi:hypothetical protein
MYKKDSGCRKKERNYIKKSGETYYPDLRKTAIPRSRM